MKQGLIKAMLLASVSFAGLYDVAFKAELSEAARECFASILTLLSYIL